MRRLLTFGWPVSVLLLFAGAAVAAPADKPYDQIMDVQYGEAKGQPLYMDIFVPNGKARFSYYQPNDNGQGLGLIDIISGGWSSKRARQGDHEAAQVFSIFTARGYTVFAPRPGSLPDFTALEMVENVKRAIRWVKAHAAEYGVDPDRLALMGASAGGHLASLTVIDAEPGDANAADPLLRQSTQVKAVATFFPPTDFLDWGGGMAPYDREPYLIFSDGLEGKSMEAIAREMERISPARQVRGKIPPLFLVHGTADPIVPFQQAGRFKDALEAYGNDVTLVVKEGGGHFWITIPEEIIKAANWIDTQLNDGKLATQAAAAAK